MTERRAFSGRERAALWVGACGKLTMREMAVADISNNASTQGFIRLGNGKTRVVEELRSNTGCDVSVRWQKSGHRYVFALRATTLDVLQSFVDAVWSSNKGDFRRLFDEECVGEDWIVLARTFAGMYPKEQIAKTGVYAEAWESRRTSRASRSFESASQPRDISGDSTTTEQIVERVLRDALAENTPENTIGTAAGVPPWEEPLPILRIPDVNDNSDKLIPYLLDRVTKFHEHHHPHSSLMACRLTSASQIEYLKGQADLLFIGNGEMFGNEPRLCFVELKTHGGPEPLQARWAQRPKSVLGDGAYRVFRASDLQTRGLAPIIEWMCNSGQSSLRLTPPKCDNESVPDDFRRTYFLWALFEAFRGYGPEDRGRTLAAYVSASAQLDKEFPELGRFGT